MGNYISMFILHIGTIKAPLAEQTENTEWLWTDVQKAPFEQVN